LLPRATTTDSFVTTANQTINTGWSAAGQSDLMNQWFATKLADTTINHLLSAASQRDSVDSFKWRVNGTANYITSDGTHPTATGHEFLAEDLRLITYAL
jgi:lysophospholipase L1-like esterase